MDAITQHQQPSFSRPEPVRQASECDECLGSGGWFRYEPALEPNPGLLYLSCMQCRGSGKLALARG